jgi:TATA-binding protein-associated factor Taf7
MAFNFQEMQRILEVERFPVCAATTIRLKRVKRPGTPDVHVYDSMVKDVYEDTHRAFNQRLAIGFRLLK